MTIPREQGIWFKSSRSAATQDCVEVNLGEIVGVRDTKARQEGALTIPAASWSAFLVDVTK